MSAALVYEPRLAEYRFAAGHPMRPERFTLAVSLMRHWGLLEPSDSVPGGVDPAAVLVPRPCGDTDLKLIHSGDYLAAVKAAGESPASADSRFGVGAGDTPAFTGMHDAAALVVGATVVAVDSILDGSVLRAFSPSGGMHHAQHDRASGFCIYNDCAVAIARATRDHPGLRIAYLDIDAHHGDGVEAAFAHRSDVLTVSLHESGRYLFPGTGAARDIGSGAGRGFALNVPLPPFAGPDEFALAFDHVVEPAMRAFAPDLIVAQLGADSHKGDPLTHLHNTIAGHAALVRRTVVLAGEVCSGRLAATGGGGYQPFTVVPRMWACAMAELLEAPIPARVPEPWVAECSTVAGDDAWLVRAAGTETFFDDADERDADAASTARDLTGRAVAEVQAASPLLAG